MNFQKVVKDQRSKAEIEEEMKMIKWMKKRYELKQMLKSGKKMQQFKVEELKVILIYFIWYYYPNIV